MDGTYAGLVGHILNIINVMIPGLFGIMFVYFVWKMIDSWILHAGEETAREDGKKYALIAVFVFVLAVSAWGIIRLLINSLFG